MSAKVKCPACNRIYAFKPEFAGKSATCKCGHKIHFPEMPAASAPPPAQEACPNCKAFMPPGAVLCTTCGYNKSTGRIVTGTRADMARSGAPADRVSTRRVVPVWAKFSVATVVVLLVGIAGWMIYPKMFESPREAPPLPASASPSPTDVRPDDASASPSVAGAVAEVPPTVSKETPGAAGPARADGTAAGKRFPARQFSSKVPLDVYVRVNSSDVPTPFTELQPIGRTPTDKPLEIPACDAWWVSPAGAPLADVVKEVQAQALPGLALPGSATNDDLAFLKGLTGLQSLVLTGTKVTDAGLAQIKGLTGLQTLYLRETQVTDAGLEQLKGLTGLQALDLSGTRVTDAGLAHLKGLTGLQTLSRNAE
jgi:hypothetical protein